MTTAVTRELHEAFNFNVFFSKQPDVSAAFQSVSQVIADVSVETYREAGATIPIKDPGFVEFQDVTLTRGASRNLYFYNWLLDVVRASVGFEHGFPVPDIYKRDLVIDQNNRKRDRVLKAITLVNAFPSSVRIGQWDNSTDEVVIESMTLVYDYFRVKAAKDLSTTKAGT